MKELKLYLIYYIVSNVHYVNVSPQLPLMHLSNNSRFHSFITRENIINRTEKEIKISLERR